MLYNTKSRIIKSSILSFFIILFFIYITLFNEEIFRLAEWLPTLFLVLLVIHLFYLIASSCYYFIRKDNYLGYSYLTSLAIILSFWVLLFFWTLNLLKGVLRGTITG